MSKEMNTKEFQQKSTKVFQRSNSRKQTRKHTNTIIIKPLEGTQQEKEKRKKTIIKQAALRKSGQLKESQNLQDDREQKDDQQRLRLKTEERFDMVLKKTINSNNMRVSQEQNQFKELNLQRTTSRNSDADKIDKIQHHLQLAPQISALSPHPSLMLQGSIIMRSRHISQAHNLKNNNNYQNRNNPLVIPARQVESDEENEGDSDFDDDENFLEEIERIENQNKKLQNQLDEQENLKHKNHQLRDLEIEKNYMQAKITIHNLIEDLQSKKDVIKDFPNRVKVDSYNMFQQMDSPSPQKQYSKSTFRRKLEKESSMENQFNINHLNYDLESPKKLTNKRIPSIQQQYNINHLIKNHSRRPIESDAMSNISEFSSNNVFLHKKSSSNMYDHHLSQFHKENKDKGKNIVFTDEDFYEHSQRIRSQSSRKNTHLSSTSNKERQKRNTQKNKSVLQDKDNKEKTEQQRVNIINQVLSKDEGELYRKLFENKHLIPRVLYNEPQNYDEDILPFEKREKEEKKRQEKTERIKKIKYQIQYQAEKRVKLRSQILLEKKNRNHFN